VTRFVISLVLWIKSSSERESMANVLSCSISLKTSKISSFDIVFLRLLIFNDSFSSKDVVSYP
jgi:hypothetical protein